MLSPPEFAGRHAGVHLEELVEDTLVGEVEPVDDFLDGNLRVPQHILGLQDDERVDPVGGALSADLLDDLGEILGREAEFVGIEGHAPLGGMVLRHQGQEALQQHLGARGSLYGRMFPGRGQPALPHVARHISQRRHQRPHHIFLVADGGVDELPAEPEVILRQVDLGLGQMDAGL